MNKYDNTPPSLFSSPWVFFGATFAWSWVFWGWGILLNISMESTFGFGLLLLGVLGPMVAGIGFTYLNALGQEDIQQFAHQCGFTSLETFSFFKGFMLNFTKASSRKDGKNE